MNNPNYELVLKKLQNNATVITPNNRLAKTLLEDYFHHSVHDVIEKPNCLSYDAFIQQLYFKLTHHNPSKTHPVLLTKQQASFLWSRQLCTANDIHQGLISKAYEAWSRCQLWQIDINHTQFDLTEQTQQFCQWGNDFSLTLRKLNFLTNEQVVPYLISQEIADLPNQILWFCFDEYTPNQTALQHYFTNQGITNQTLDLALQQSPQLLFAAKDEQHELITLINWLTEQLSLQKKRIGVVVPDLNQRANQLNRVLQHYFQTDEFNISLGKTLTDYPLISHALCWLSLSQHSMTKEHTTLLLSSPFLAFSKTELLPRAQFLQTNLLLQERVMDHTALIKALTKQAPMLATTLKQLENYPKHASPQNWVALWQNRLTSLGFPGEYPLDSSNYQCYQRFLLLFDEFKQFTGLVSTLSAYEAMQTLSELAQNTIFQPEKISSAPIQVLGLLEAAGCQFDMLWVTGMTDDCLPHKTQLSPFIPITIQKEQGLPYTSLEKEFTLAEKTLTRFKHAAATVVFSYPQYSEEKNNLPTMLLTDLPSTSNLSFSTETSQQTKLRSNPPNQKITYEETYRLPLNQTHYGSTALLANQAKCPFRAFAAHRLHLKKEVETSDGPNARERGTMIHKIMELFWQQVKTQRNLFELNEESLALLIDEAIEKAISPYQSSRKYSFPPLIQQVEKHRLKQLINAILAWERQRPDFSVTAVEKKYSFELSNIHFDVRIDRLDTVENNQQWIIDYKTTLPAKTPWKEDRPTEPQILLYALLDEQINTILFIELKNGKIDCKGLSEEQYDLPGIKQTAEKESWTANKTQWRHQLTELAQEFHDGVCIPKPINPSICEQCDFPDLCRLPFKS